MNPGHLIPIGTRVHAANKFHVGKLVAYFTAEYQYDGYFGQEEDESKTLLYAVVLLDDYYNVPDKCSIRHLVVFVDNLHVLEDE